MRLVSPRGWATFAWQSDYGQFYLVDHEDSTFTAPIEITPEMERRSFFQYTDRTCHLYPELSATAPALSIYDTEPDHSPVEEMNGKPWTRIETAGARFPLRKFTISSPSMPAPLPAGPVFLLEAERMAARISWTEFQGSRDDSGPVDPDIIDDHTLAKLTTARREAAKPLIFVSALGGNGVDCGPTTSGRYVKESRRALNREFNPLTNR